MNRIKELERLIRYHKAAYYSGSPEISDLEYDSIENELRKIDPQNSALSIVGSKISGANKIKHEKRMLSLQKTYNFDELEQWRANREVISTNKIDGVSCSIIYHDGRFILAKTRGDGQFGENISESVKWMETVPTTVSNTHAIEVRGEMYCDEQGFYMLSKKMESLGLDQPTSPRNIVAGIISRKDQVHLAQYIKFMAFDLIDNSNDLKKESEKFEILAKENFTIPSCEIHTSEKTIKAAIAQAQTFMSEGEYQIDGIVFALNELGLQKELGETSHHPRFKMAFKFPGVVEQSVIKKISWGVSRNGVLTPVANINPVELSGAMISRVTLHNFGIVEMNQLKEGDTIEIIRSGEVIPKFMSVVADGGGQYRIPEICPECQQKVFQKDIRLICNNEECIGRKREGMVYFIQKIGIDDLSYKRVNTLIDAGLIKDYHDIFNITAKQLLKIEKVKEKLAEKIISNIKKCKKISLLKFITALGISGGAGNKTEKIISAGFNTIDKILSLSIEQLIKVDSFAEKSAREYVFSLQKKKTIVEKLLETGIIIEEVVSRSKTRLTGKKICITGTLSRKRGEIEQDVKEAGGDIVSSVSKKTDYLVTNDIDSNSSKFKKAKALDISIISESELQKMLG